MKTTKLLLGVAAIAAVLTASVNAQNISVSVTGLSPGINKISTAYDGSFFQLQDAGVLQTSVGNAFCVQPGVPLNYPETLVYTVTNVSNLASNDIIAKLVGGYLASPQDALNAAAVQLAIWEVLLDGSTSGSLTTGNMQIAGTSDLNLINLANGYLAGANGYTAVPITFLVNNDDPHRQNIITWSAVPEPSSMLLLGLTSLVFFRRKR